MDVLPDRLLSASREQRLAYLLLRVLTGFDFFGHGFARLATGSHLPAFAQGMVRSMAATPLPSNMVLITGYVVPPVELLIGVLLLLGYGIRLALILAFLLMFVLMFGITLKQDWSTAGQQLQYGLVLAALLFGRESFDSDWPSILKRDKG